MSTDQLCFVVAGDAASVETRARPTPKEGECLVKVLLVGVCNTDLEILKGYMGFAGVVGHEFVGRVETAPAGAEHLVGQRVVGDINLCCNQPASCKVCELGLSNPVARNHCPVRTVLGILNKDGCYAEYITLPVVNLHLVPPNVSTENAAFVEPCAARFVGAQFGAQFCASPENF